MSTFGYTEKPTFNWQRLKLRVARVILSGPQRSKELALRYHLVVWYFVVPEIHQNIFIKTGSFPPQSTWGFWRKKSPPKKKHKQTKRKGSGSKTCPFFNGGSGSLFGIKAHIAFRIAAPCHPPTPPTCPTTWMRSGAIFRAKAKSVGKTLGVGRRWRETPWRFNEAVHPSISPMLRLFRFGVFQKKQQKTTQNLQNFINDPLFSSLQPLWVAHKTLPQLFRLTTSGSFCPLTGFISASCADTMTWRHLVFGPGVRFVGWRLIQGMYNKDILLMVEKSGQKPPGM